MSAVNGLLRRLRVLIDRTVLNRVAYKGRVRVLQVSSRAGVALDGVEHIEPAGFSSHPLPGAEAVVVNLGGNSGRAIVIVVNDRSHRVVIEEGESVIYNMPHGDFVKVKADRSVHVKAGLRVFLETPETELSGNLIVRGNAQIEGTVHADGDVSAGNISLKNHRTSGIGRGTQVSDGPVP